jgi:hypothetical protein
MSPGWRWSGEKVVRGVAGLVVQAIATAGHRAIRVDRFVWHPDTVVCETRTKGQLIRPR